MENNEYLSFAKKTLKIMEISFNENDAIEDLIKKIENPIILPATATEWEISRLAKLLSIEISKHGDKGLISQLLEQLKSEVTFSWLD